MAGEFIPLVPKRYAGLPLRTTPEARFWGRFDVKEKFELPASVSRVEFSPVEPYDLAITASARVTVVDGKSNKINRQIGSFKDVAYGGSFKKDGLLLVAGCENGSVQIFDVQKRATLRSLSGHTSAVRTTMFSSDGLRVLSGSDDKTVKLWDLPTSTQLVSLDGHEDYVRAQARSQMSPHLWATGCYDHKLRIFDLRKQKAIFTLNHDYPIESVLLLPGGGLAVSAGGQEARIHDLFAGGKVLQRLRNHAKAITCVCLDPSESKLLTGGLDNQVKVHNLNNFEVVASMYLSNQVLSLDISPNRSRLAAGLASGVCEVRLFNQKSVLELRERSEPLAERRKSEENRLFKELARGKQKGGKKGPNPGSLRYFLRGKHEGAVEGDVTIGAKNRIKLKEYDVLLKKFMYGAALDRAMEQKRIPVTAAICEDLVFREGLNIALSNRGPQRLLPLVELIEKTICDPRYSDLMLLVANTVLDKYGGVIGKSEIVDKALLRLHRVVQREVEIQNELLKLVGMMQLALGGKKNLESGDIEDID